MSETLDPVAMELDQRQLAERAYRDDKLSGSYHRTRVDHAAEARSISQAKLARAHEVAARIVASHGNTITVEDCSISTWARL